MDTHAPKTEAKKGKGFMRSAVVVAIVIVLNLFFNYAISLVYKAPTWDEYMPSTQVVEPITDRADCLSAGGQWTEATPDQADMTDDSGQKTPYTGYCDPNYTKQMDFTAATKAYDRTVFIILVALGVVSLVLGAVFANAVLALSFSWGGVLSLLIASVRYWSDADSLVKVIILAAALGALIWIAVRKISK